MKNLIPKDAGFTMIEVLVSMTLFGIVSAGVAQGFISQMRANNSSEIRSQAVQAAIQVIDVKRTLDPASLPSSGSSSAQNIQINGKTFSVVITYCKTTSLCSASSRELTAVVKHKGKKVYDVSTVFAQLR